MYTYFLVYIICTIIWTRKACPRRTRLVNIGALWRSVVGFNMLRGVSVKGAVSKPCKICKKTFCCAECRDRHVNKVHPGLNGSCSLCASDVLPLQLFESEKLDSENEQLLCHIIDEHLPLHCQLCGDTFESREDFKAFGNFCETDRPLPERSL